MATISTLLYIVDNCEGESGKVYQLDDNEELGFDDFSDVWNYLDDLIQEVDLKVVNNLLKQISLH